MSRRYNADLFDEHAGHRGNHDHFSGMDSPIGLGERLETKEQNVTEQNEKGHVLNLETTSVQSRKRSACLDRSHVMIGEFDVQRLMELPDLIQLLLHRSLEMIDRIRITVIDTIWF